jgi:hypothetical protein
MKTIVISQPMYFPWVGMLEQMRMADVHVHLDDAQFSKGGFFNRVQVKTGQGTPWLTVPLAENKLGQPLNLLRPAAHDWRRKHLATLSQAYAGAPHSEAMIALAESVLGAGHDSLASLGAASMEALADYFGILPPVIQWASRMNRGETGTERVLAICRALGAERYVTGHGARAYLDHAAFEAEGIRVEYMEYRLREYPQLHGAFTAHVSALDLVANAGPDGREVIASGSVYWKEA